MDSAEKTSKLRPSNHPEGPCYKAVRFFSMYEFAILFLSISINKALVSYNA